jgi:hypothetical protein
MLKIKDEKQGLKRKGQLSLWNDSEYSVWRQENKNSPTAAHACRERRLKWVASAWGCNWATLSPGDINAEAWSSRLGVERRVNNPAS